MKRFIVPLFFALLAFGASTYSALAHAQIDHCIPVPGTAVSAAPKEVRCWFTEEIDDKQSTLTVTDSSGGRVDNNDGKVDLNVADRRQMFATLKALQDGVYTVTWHTVTTGDQGTSDGTWYFGVGQVTVPTYAAPTGAPATGGASSSASSASSATTPAASSTTSSTAVAVAPTAGAATPAASATAAVPAVAPTLGATTPAAPATAPDTGKPPDETVVVVAGIAEALVIIGVLIFLYRTTR